MAAKEIACVESIQSDAVWIVLKSVHETFQHHLNITPVKSTV